MTPGRFWLQRCCPASGSIGRSDAPSQVRRPVTTLTAPGSTPTPTSVLRKGCGRPLPSAIEPLPRPVRQPARGCLARLHAPVSTNGCSGTALTSAAVGLHLTDPILYEGNPPHPAPG